MSLPDGLRWFAFVVLAWYLPGMVFARACFPRAAPEVRLAVCWIAVPVVFSVLAVVLGIAGVDPVLVLALVAVAGIAGAARLRPWTSWAATVREARFAFLLPVILGVAITLAPGEQSLTSDTNAHVAAIRRSVEEAAVFPERGFHGDDASWGVDPRFGTLHALAAAASRVTGLEAREAWNAMRGVGLAVILAGALALLTTFARAPLAVAAGVVALLATHGGVYYNILSVSAYPLWLSLGIVWTLIAAVARSGFERPGVAGLLAAATLAGLAGIHFFAYMLCGFLLGALVLVAPAGRRAGAWKLLAVGVTASLPWVGARLFTSYVNANPIHQKVWQCMEWAPGLYSANPLFVAGWLFPVGAVALLWGALRWRRLRGDLAWRWLMSSAGLALVWILVPWFLTPSMELIGFLPLRLLMGVGGAFLLALLIEHLGRWRKFVALAAIVLLSLPLAQRVERLTPDGDSGGEEWRELIAALESEGAGRPVVLSDPFTMLALSADAAVDVVAVPDGRSSPRDPQAIDRLRDAWRAMSPSVSGAVTDEVLDRRQVTHVVLNRGLPEGLASYEYPVHTPSFERQMAKFASNPERFRPIWTGGKLALFATTGARDPAWDLSWLRDCSATAAGPGVDIGYGYEVANVSAVLDESVERRMLRLSGRLRWTGDGTAPDRQLVVRLDRARSGVPEILEPVGKPVRKAREFFGAPRSRYRWATSPGMGRCPTWLAENSTLALDLELPVAASIAPGSYVVTLAMRDRSVFEPLQARDLFVDADSWQGPEIATVEVR